MLCISCICRPVCVSERVREEAETPCNGVNSSYLDTEVVRLLAKECCGHVILAVAVEQDPVGRAQSPQAVANRRYTLRASHRLLAIAVMVVRTHC